MLVNPSLIIEVLLSSTAEFDRGDKFIYYKSIKSFSEYLLISQERPHIVHYTKQDEEIWLMREHRGLDTSFYLESLDCDISLKDVYLNIKFEPSKEPKHPLEIIR